MRDMFVLKRKWITVEPTYVQDLINVLLFQIRPRYHSAIKIHLSFEAHFTQAHVSGLHVMDGSGYSNVIQLTLGVC